MDTGTAAGTAPALLQGPLPERASGVGAAGWEGAQPGCIFRQSRWPPTWCDFTGSGGPFQAPKYLLHLLPDATGPIREQFCVPD